MALSPLVFSDTTNKNGLIQEIEFWCGLNDGQISGDATLLKVTTARINAGFDRIMPFLYSYSDYLKWDDQNHTDLPVGTINIVSGQADYTIASDDNSLAILNITNVQILVSPTGTQYFELQEMTTDDYRSRYATSPSTTDTGVPSHFYPKGNTIFLWPKPNYSATSGAKLFFEREASYFASTDTTKEAGIPRPMQALLPLYASYDWLIVNKPDNQVLITRVEDQIRKREQALQRIINARFPRRAIITSQSIRYR